MQEVIESDLFSLLYVPQSYEHPFIIERCVRVARMIGEVHRHLLLRPVIERVQRLSLLECSSGEQSKSLPPVARARLKTFYIQERHLSYLISKLTRWVALVFAIRSMAVICSW